MIVQEDPSMEDIEFVVERVLAVRPSDAPDVDRKWKKIAIWKRDGKNDKAGCAVVYIHPGWAYLDLMWVDESLRGRGVGTALLKNAEDEAVKRSCHGMYLWTQDFEAPRFYEKHGYTRFVAFEDFVKGHQRIGYQKYLR